MQVCCVDRPAQVTHNSYFFLNPECFGVLVESTYIQYSVKHITSVNDRMVFSQVRKTLQNLKFDVMRMLFRQDTIKITVHQENPQQKLYQTYPMLWSDSITSGQCRY